MGKMITGTVKSSPQCGGLTMAAPEKDKCRHRVRRPEILKKEGPVPLPRNRTILVC